MKNKLSRTSRFLMPALFIGSLFFNSSFEAAHRSKVTKQTTLPREGITTRYVTVPQGSTPWELGMFVCLNETPSETLGCGTIIQENRPDSNGRRSALIKLDAPVSTRRTTAWQDSGNQRVVAIQARPARPQNHVEPERSLAFEPSVDPLGAGPKHPRKTEGP